MYLCSPSSTHFMHLWWRDLLWAASAGLLAWHKMHSATLKKLLSEKHYDERYGSLVTFAFVTHINCLGKSIKSQGIHSPVSLHPPLEVSGIKSVPCKYLRNSKTSFTFFTFQPWCNIPPTFNQFSDCDYSSCLYQRRRGVWGNCKPKVTCVYTF